MESYRYSVDGHVIRESDGAIISENNTTLARQELDDWVADGNVIAPYVEGE